MITFNKIIGKIAEVFSNMSGEEVVGQLIRFKVERGDISNHSIDQIIGHISATSLTRDAVNEVQGATAGVASGQPQPFISQRPDPLGSHQISRQEESKRTCSICLDEMDPDDMIEELKALECAHTFHKRCINKWLKVKYECPNCRKYEVPREEFPSLLRPDNHGRSAYRWNK